MKQLDEVLEAIQKRNAQTVKLEFLVTPEQANELLTIYKKLIESD